MHCEWCSLGDKRPAMLEHLRAGRTLAEVAALVDSDVTWVSSSRAEAERRGCLPKRGCPECGTPSRRGHRCAACSKRRRTTRNTANAKASRRRKAAARPPNPVPPPPPPVERTEARGCPVCGVPTPRRGLCATHKRERQAAWKRHKRGAARLGLPAANATPEPPPPVVHHTTRPAKWGWKLGALQ